jgi:CDP-glucose 4,6-dehydratase
MLRLVPDLARAVAAGTSATIRNPRAVRPWQHVLEPLRGYVLLAERLMNDARRYSGAWNFGPAPESFESVERVLEMLAEPWQGKLEWSVAAGSHPHEAERLALDSPKASVELGWTSRLRLEDTLRLAVQWYDAHRAGSHDMRRFTEAQIAWYAGLDRGS